jgi:hypothetical protein
MRRLLFILVFALVLVGGLTAWAVTRSPDPASTFEEECTPTAEREWTCTESQTGTP